MLLDGDICYRALVTRDARFDGRFFTAVTSTGIFCRPVCPAPIPKRGNCVFYGSAEAAHEAGFRPCLRCRPELAPRFSGSNARSPIVQRALAQIAEGALDESTICAFATGLGVTERHLRRLFVQELGAPPLAIVQTRRLLFAKQLLDETSLPIIQVALAAGFRSLRRFNEVVRTTYNMPPRELRKMRRTAPRHDGSAVTLRLPYSPPYDWQAMIGFLRARAIPGVESADERSYRRTICLAGHHGIVEVSPAPEGNHLIASIRFPDVALLGEIVSRLRDLFDLGANIAEITGHLALDPALRPMVEQHPGLRVPGAWDRFELGVRAILGQQVSVAAATTIAGRIARAHGTPLALEQADAAAPELQFVFPDAAALAGADLTGIGLTRSRANTINSFAAAVLENRDLLRDTVSLNDCAIRRLTPLPGIGQWTAYYIAMRALRQPDAFPSTDLGLRRAIERIEGPMTPDAICARTQAWRPWRAYAALHLWTNDAAPPSTTNRNGHA